MSESQADRYPMVDLSNPAYAFFPHRFHVVSGSEAVGRVSDWIRDTYGPETSLVWMGDQIWIANDDVAFGFKLRWYEKADVRQSR